VYPKIYPVNTINTTCKPAKTIPSNRQYNHNKCTPKKRDKLTDSISELATHLPGKLLIYFLNSGQNGEIVAVNAISAELSIGLISVKAPWVRS
jgi:hypothetical protein